MSSDYIRLQDSQPTKGSQPMMNKAVSSINDSFVNQEDQLALHKSIRGLTPQEDYGNDIDNQDGLAQKKMLAQKETTDFTQQDGLIKDYFLREETKSPLVYLDAKTSLDTSFKISDEDIICFDVAVKILKKISMLEKTVDENKKTYAKNVLISISQEELLKEAVKRPLDQDKVEGRSISEEELAIEKVTRVEPSANKHEIFVGTSFGRIAVISSETFEVYGILRNSFESPVKDIAIKKNILIVGHENGQIDLYEKQVDQHIYKKSVLKTPVKSRSQISCNAPQFKCPKDHTLVYYEKDPYGYGGGARCDECKTNSCINMGYLYHCPECSYDLCKNCTQDYDKYGKKIEVTSKCTQGHTLELRTKDPYGYGGGAGCDECGASSCINMGYLFHCPTCKYDFCANCDMDRYGKRLKPTCNKRHEMQILKEKPSYYNGSPGCDFCGKPDIAKDGLFYHCKDCKFDKCYYCNTKQDIMALKVSHLTEHLAVVQRPLNESTAKKFLHIYNLKDKKKVEYQNFIFCSPPNNNFFKKIIYFTQENLITRSDNRFSYKILALKNGEQYKSPETLDSETIQKIDIWKDNKTIILIGDSGKIYLYDDKGKEATLPNVQAYFIWGVSEMNFTSLQDKVTILKLPQRVNDQQQVFTELQNNLYFANDDKSFFIELRGNPQPSFTDKLNDALITPDGKIFAQEKIIDGITTVVIYDQIKNEELKILPGYDLVSCSQNSKYLYCETTKQSPKMSVQVNLETFETHNIYESESTWIQVNKNDTLAYIRNYDKELQEYNLHVVDIKEGEKLFEYKTKLKVEFYYRLSNDEKYIILSTKEKKLQKIKVINGKELGFVKEIDHAPGLTGQISFSKDSSKFICGGEDSSDLIMYDANTLEVLYTVEQHKGKGNYSFFTKANRLVTKEEGEAICWDVENMKEPLKLFQAKVGLNIYSYNRILIGFMINNEPRVWNERLMHELSNNIKLLLPTQYENVQKEKEWTVGPLNKLLPQILQQFWECNFEQQQQKLPHLLQFVIMPYGYTFLEKLVFDGKIDLIVAAIEDSNMKYITDIYGNNPLTYALKRKNFEVLNILLDFFIKNPAYIKSLRFIEFIALLKLGPSQIPDLLNKFVEPIMQNHNLGEKIDEIYETFFLQDPLKKFKEEDVIKELLVKDPPEKDKFPIIFNATMMNLRFTCKESTDFYVALDECPCEEIFGTTLIQKVIEYKWSKTKIVANIFLAFQIAFLLSVTYSSFQPGMQLMLYVMMCFASLFGLCEFIVFIESKNSFVYVDKFKLVIIFLVFTYCLCTLHEMTETVDSLLPFINLFAWFNLVIEMQQFERTRQFVCVVMSSVQSIAGFLIFLFLMICTFASTTNLFLKNNERHKAFQKAPLPWSFDQEFFQYYNATRTLPHDIDELWQQLFDTWITIVKGDYNDELASTISYQIFLLLLTFVANVTLLNLIVAIMSDAYGEVMTSIVVKKTKSLNAMMLRYDKMLFKRQEKSNQRQLIWVTYNGESEKGWVSQIDAINSQVKKSSKEVLDQIIFTDQTIVEKQKDQANSIHTLSGRVSTLLTDVTDQTKQVKDIRARQDQQISKIGELIIYKEKKEKKAQDKEKAEKEGKIEVLKKLKEIEKNQKQFQAQVLGLLQSMMAKTGQELPVFQPVETNPSEILDDQKMIKLQEEIIKRFPDHNKMEVILQLTNGELDLSINQLRQDFLNKAKVYSSSVVIIKSDQGQEFGFFVPDAWENTVGKSDLYRDFYSPYKNCKEVLNGKPFAFLFNDGQIEIFEWIHHQTALIWSRDDEFLSISMGIAINGQRKGDYAYLDPLCWQLPDGEFKKCEVFRNDSLAFCNQGNCKFKAQSIEVFGTNSQTSN